MLSELSFTHLATEIFYTLFVLSRNGLGGKSSKTNVTYKDILPTAQLHSGPSAEVIEKVRLLQQV